MLTSYTVQKGDTLWKIAQHYQLTLKELICANPQIEDPNLIMPGEIIYIPKENLKTNDDCGCNIVQNEQSKLNRTPSQTSPLPSLEEINLKQPKASSGTEPQHSATPQTELFDISQIKNTNHNTVSAAQQQPITSVWEPRFAPIATTPHHNNTVLPKEVNMPRPLIYTVRAGDSIYLISEMFDIDYEHLLAANPQLANAEMIYPGDKIFIPKKITMPQAHYPYIPPKRPCPYDTNANTCPWLKSDDIFCPHCGKKIN